MAKLKSLFTESQWDFIDRISEPARTRRLAIVLGGRLQEWFREERDEITRSFAALMDLKNSLGISRSLFDQATLDIAVAMVSGSRLQLGLVVSDQGYLRNIVRQQGVAALSWDEARLLASTAGFDSLSSTAIETIVNGKARGNTPLHIEMKNLSEEMRTALSLGVAEGFGAGDLDGETVAALKAFIRDRRKSLKLLREVALSAIIATDEVPGDITDAEKVSLRTSSLDLVVYGLPPLNRPLLAIEYDGRDHRKPEQVQKDASKNSLLAKVGLPLLRIDTSEARARRSNNAESKTAANFRLSAILTMATRIAMRALDDAAISAREVSEIVADFGLLDALAVSTHGLRFSALDEVSRLQVQRLARRSDVEKSIDRSETMSDRFELERESAGNATLEAQLVEYEVDPSWVSDFRLAPGTFGMRGTARLQLPDGSAPRSLCTTDVVLQAPGMDPEFVDQLVREQIYIEIASIAAQLSPKPPQTLVKAPDRPRGAG